MQAHSGIGILPHFVLLEKNCASYFLQQSSANLHHAEVSVQPDLRSLRSASEIISGIAVTSVHRKPQVAIVPCHFLNSLDLIWYVRLSMALLVQLLL
jgi:hypothetical protein